MFDLNGSFSENWREMQKDYNDIKKLRSYDNTFEYTNQFYNKLILDLDKLVVGLPDINFLKNSCLTGIMVRGVVDELKVYEETFLSECLDSKTKQYMSRFEENSQGVLDLSSDKFNCSATTLGHLYYVAKTLEMSKDDYPEVILEVGGGFGNLARCFKKILPGSTVVIIDLPEMCVIQKMFLNYTAPEINVFLHKNSGQDIKKGAINLIPLCFLDKVLVNPDLFISTFALSEAPESMQNFVINKKFFNAKQIFITGQIDGWRGLGHNWMVNHNSLVASVRNNYDKVICTPFHWINKGFLSYEIYGGSK